MKSLSVAVTGAVVFFSWIFQTQLNAQTFDSSEVVELGHAAISSGDLTSAAAWYLRAAAMDRENPESANGHAIRLQLLLNRLPALVQVFPSTNPDEEVCEVSLTPDGKYALIPVDARSFSIVNTETGEPLNFQVAPRSEPITSALLDYEGRSVWIREASGFVSHITAQGEQSIFIGFAERSNSIGRSPCGRYVHVISEDRDAVTLFHATSGEIIKQLDSKRMGILSVRYSRDIARAAIARSESIDVFDLPSGHLTRSVETPSDLYASGILSDDGNELVYYHDRTGFLLDLSGLSNDIKNIDFANNPGFIFGSGEQRELVTVETMKVHSCKLANEGGIKDFKTEFVNGLQGVLARTSRNEMLLNCGTHISKRNVSGNLEWLAPLPFPARTAFLGRQEQLLVMQDVRNNVLVWDLACKRVHPAPTTYPRVDEVDSQFLKVSGEHGNSALSLIPFANPKEDVDWHWSPQRKFLCMVDRYLGFCPFGVKPTGSIRIWNVMTGRPVGEKLAWEQHLNQINSGSAAFSPDGSQIAFHGTDHDGDFAVLVSNIADGSASILGSALPMKPSQVAFSSDGKALLALSHDFVTVKGLLHGNTIGNIRAPGIHAAAASKEGKRVAVLHSPAGLETRVSIYDVASGEILSSVPVPNLNVLQRDVLVSRNYFAFTNDDQYIISCQSDGTSFLSASPLSYLGFHFREEFAIADEPHIRQGHPSVWDFRIPSDLTLTLSDAASLLSTQSALGLRGDSRAERLSVPLINSIGLSSSQKLAPHLFTNSDRNVVAVQHGPQKSDWWSKFKNGDYADVVKLRPECQPAWLAIAYEYQEKRQWPEAAEAFMQSDRLFPDGLHQSYYGIHKALCRSGRFSEAFAIAEREGSAPDQYTERGYLDYWLTRAEIGLGKIDGAQSVLRNIAKSEDTSEVIRFERAFEYPNLEEDDTDAVARAVQGLWQLAKNDIPAARKILDEAVAEEDFRDRAFAARAAMKIQLKEWTSALSDLTTAIETLPSNQYYRLSRLECAVETQNWEVAIADIEYLQNAFPSDVSQFCRRAEISALQKNVKDREVSCRELISRFGESSDVANRDSALWECLLSPCVLPSDELLRLGEKLNEDFADKSLYVETLILAQYRAKRFEDAVQTFARIPDPDERLVAGLYTALAKVRIIDSPENRKLATTALDKLVLSLPQENWRQKLDAKRYMSDAAELSIHPSAKP